MDGIYTCPLFGPQKELSENKLPTYEDTIRHCFHVRSKLLIVTPGGEPSFANIADKVASTIGSLYTTILIPIVSHTRIIQMLKAYNEKYKALMKPYQKRKNNENYKKQMNTFLEKAKSDLFDIASCKCNDFTSCGCEPAKKVPLEYWEFLADQRTKRLMSINSVQLSRGVKRKLDSEMDSDEQVELVLSQEMNQIDISSSEQMSSQDPPSQQSEFNVKLPLSAPSTSQMRVALPKTARMADRLGLSDRAVAALASAVLEDFGIITAEDKSMVIDRHKIRRERSKYRSQLQKPGSDEEVTIQGLYFDGRKDRTLEMVQKGTKYYRGTKTEEHISLIEEPGSKYVGHVTPISGTGVSICNSIFNFLTEKHVVLDSVVAVGCDGTVVNTGSKNGVISHLERKLEKPLQRFVCLLHFNELPLRHLFEHLDGRTTGPRTNSGPIAQSLDNCEKLPVIRFKKVNFNLPIVTTDDLSTDQRYLLQLSKAINEGTCSDDLSRRNPGPISHSRWLTKANRILRLYVSTENPSSQLKTLVEFILNVYAPIWFTVKIKNSCIEGPKILFEVIQRSRYLPDHLKAIIDPVISRNAFFAHPENLLLAMVTDSRAHVQDLALNRILEARNRRTGTAIREFKVPRLNFEAKDYSDLIFWSECVITQPPLLAGHDEEILAHLSEYESEIRQNIETFPCHTQAVERCVKLVTEAAGQICGGSNRDGYIKSKIQSRSIMPQFETKGDYKM